jgi:Fe-S cluster assembly ATPase SufC
VFLADRAAENWANRYEERFQYLRAWRPDGWEPEIDILGAEQVRTALDKGRGIIFWAGNFSFNDLIAKIAWRRLGLAVSHFSRPIHGFSTTRFGVRYLNAVRRGIEDRYLGERLMAVGERHYGTIRSEARSWLARLEVDDGRIDELPGNFSGGMQQRLQIARNLVSHPRLVFMDEPTGGLDVSVQARLLDLMRNLVSELGLAAIVVTHDLAVARLLSHRVMVMKGGLVIETGLTDQVLEAAMVAYGKRTGREFRKVGHWYSLPRILR